MDAHDYRSFLQKLGPIIIRDRLVQPTHQTQVAMHFLIKADLAEHGKQLDKSVQGADCGYFNGISRPGGHEHYVFGLVGCQV